MKYIKSFLLIVFLFFLFIFPSSVRASANSYVSVVSPVRGSEFWDLKDETPAGNVKSQLDLVTKKNIPTTWLVRFDALGDNQITSLLKDQPEKGIFIEITPSLTEAAKVNYHKSHSWHSAGSIFLTGYAISDRQKIIDTLFNEFKKTYGVFPKSVGAWWVDAYSLSYMSAKYNIDASLIVADQYSTDDYQIWGQYWQAPYYPYARNALLPAQETKDKIPVVVSQWATRDPINGYGKAVEESTYSVQVNDYVDYHALGSDYFSKLVDIYTNQEFNKTNYLVVGLENSYSFKKYGQGFSDQLDILSERQKKGQFKIATMSDYASWYKKSFPNLSPEMTYIADNPLGGDSKVVWFMNPFYRSGLFFNSEGVKIRDLRQYTAGQEEPCLEKVCESLNFATFATRVLDEVTYSHKWLIDEGRVKNLSIKKLEQGLSISYLNQADKKREITMMPRDISLDGTISSIDGAILKATHDENNKVKLGNFKSGEFITFDSFIDVIFSAFKFLVFFIFCIFIPGVVITRVKSSQAINIFNSSVLGLILFCLLSYFLKFAKLDMFLVPIYLLPLFFFVKLKIYKYLKISINFLTIAVIVGSLFQCLAVFRSGLNFSYGIGFWGPNSHDGAWHLSLVNQLAQVPPLNPVFSGVLLKNYHYLYDLLIAQTHFITFIDPVHLIFRLYPFLFSLLLGFGVIEIARKFNLKAPNLSISLALFFVYFAGSFGWIVEYLKSKTLNGESDFWINQSSSYNLNPPFVLSLLGLILFINIISFKKTLITQVYLGLILGSLMGIKAYVFLLAVVVTLVLFIYEIIRERSFKTIINLIVALVVGLSLYIPNFTYNGTFIFAPLWFIHSMIDSPDRLGLTKLSSARSAYFDRKDYFKLILVETLSIGLFLIGNLGMRFISILGLPILYKKVTSKKYFCLLLGLVVLSFLIPFVIIQAGTPWNTIQFSYYGLFFLSVFAGFSLGELKPKLNRYFYIFILTIFVLLTPINSLVVANGYLYKNPHTYLSLKELEGLQFLAKLENGVVLTYPYDKSLRAKYMEPLPIEIYDTTAYVSAYSRKVAFLEDEIQNDILQTDYVKRRVQAKAFFEHQSSEDKAFLQRDQIKYIYLPKLFRQTLDEKTLGIKKIFSNDEVDIYGINL